MDRGACMVRLEERSSRGIKVGSPAPNMPNARCHGHGATAARTGTGRFSAGTGRGRSLRPDGSLPVLCSLHSPFLIACSFWNSYFFFFFFLFLSKIAQNNNNKKKPSKKKIIKNSFTFKSLGTYERPNCSSLN